MTNMEAISRKRFQGRVAVVVGGAQGIGKAIAVRLRREGACVVIADIDRAMLDAVSREMAEAAANGGGRDAPLSSSGYLDVRRRGR